MPRGAEYDNGIPQSDNAIEAGETKVHGTNSAVCPANHLQHPKHDVLILSMILTNNRTTTSIASTAQLISPMSLPAACTAAAVPPATRAARAVMSLVP